MFDNHTRLAVCGTVAAATDFATEIKQQRHKRKKTVKIN
jgi:hypothetical protein